MRCAARECLASAVFLSIRHLNLALVYHTPSDKEMSRPPHAFRLLGYRYPKLLSAQEISILEHQTLQRVIR